MQRKVDITMGLFSPRIRLKSLVPICRELSTMYDAGLPILRALDILQAQTRDPKARNMLIRMRNAIQNGETLGAAIKAESRYLPVYMVETISAGEAGGRLDVMFSDLADYMEKQLETRRKLIGQMIYPAILLCFAWFAATFALKLIHQLSGMFSNDRCAASFSLHNYISSYLAFQARALSIFGLGVVVSIILARMGLFGWVWGLFATYIWPFSILTRQLGLARFFRSLSLLFEAGLSTPKAIEHAAATTANPYLQRDLLRVIPRVMAGDTLTNAFHASRQMTRAAFEMLRVGEESGKLVSHLRKMADYFQEQADHALVLVSRILGIGVHLFIALLIAYVIISFWMSYFGMINNLLNM